MDVAGEMSVWACHLCDPDPDKHLENGKMDRTLFLGLKRQHFISFPQSDMMFQNSHILYILELYGCDKA